MLLKAWCNKHLKWGSCKRACYPQIKQPKLFWWLTVSHPFPCFRRSYKINLWCIAKERFFKTQTSQLFLSLYIYCLMDKHITKQNKSSIGFLLSLTSTLSRAGNQIPPQTSSYVSAWADCCALQVSVKLCTTLGYKSPRSHTLQLHWFQPHTKWRLGCVMDGEVSSTRESRARFWIIHLINLETCTQILFDRHSSFLYQV